MGRCTSGVRQGQYYLFDLGSSISAVELEAAARGEGDVHPPACLMFSATEVVSGGPPGPLADAQSLVFSVLALAGAQLPWQDSASRGDWMTCFDQRMRFAQQPDVLPEWGMFSPGLQDMMRHILLASSQLKEAGSFDLSKKLEDLGLWPAGAAAATGAFHMHT